MAKLALLIGVSNYEEGFNSLPSALKDVEAMERLLQHPEFGGFTEVETLKNPGPLAMQVAIESLFKDKVRRRDDVVLLFFSGHCVSDRNNKFYFTTRLTRKNAHGELVKSTAVSASFIQDIMSDSRSEQQVIILDGYFSNAFADVWSAKNYGYADIENQLGGDGRVILTSSNSTKYFDENKKTPAISTYTGYLVQGIETRAADLNQDQLITIEELHNYIGNRVDAAASTIEPEMYAFEERLKTIPLAKVSNHGTSLNPSQIVQAPIITVNDSTDLDTHKNRRFNKKVAVLLAAGIATIVALGGLLYWQNSQQQPKSQTLAVKTNNEAEQTILGHEDTVWSLAITADGQTLASSSGDKTIKIWDLQTGKLRRTLNGHAASVWSIALSQDGQTLVSGSGDKTIKVWNLQTGKVVKTFSGPLSTVWSIALTPDGQSLISSTGNNLIKVWNLPTGKLQYDIVGHSDVVRTIALSPDGQTLATGSWDQTIKLWNLKTGKLVRTLKGHSGKIISIAMSPDGQSLISSSNDNTLKFWNLRTGTLLGTVRGHSDHVNSVAISADGKMLASASEDHLIKLWDFPTESEIGTLNGHTEDVYAVTISPDGQTVVSGDKDGVIKIWK